MIALVKFDENGLVPVIAQDYLTKQVLMLAYMNQEALDKTLETGQVHYYSRSRKELWLKGETSGHFQNLKKICYDCDGDALLVFVEQVGVACHTGERTCFHNTLREFEAVPDDILQKLHYLISDRKANPKEGSYTNYLFDKGIDKILKKVGEETAEVIIAAKNKDKGEITYETADLLYHLSVLLVESGLDWEDINAELRKRR